MTSQLEASYWVKFFTGYSNEVLKYTCTAIYVKHLPCSSISPLKIKQNFTIPKAPYILSSCRDYRHPFLQKNMKGTKKHLKIGKVSSAFQQLMLSQHQGKKKGDGYNFYPFYIVTGNTQSVYDRLMKQKEGRLLALGWNCAFPTMKTQETRCQPWLCDCQDSCLTVSNFNVTLYQEEKQAQLLSPGRIKGNPQNHALNAYVKFLICQKNLSYENTKNRSCLLQVAIPCTLDSLWPFQTSLFKKREALFIRILPS